MAGISEAIACVELTMERGTEGQRILSNADFTFDT